MTLTVQPCGNRFRLYVLSQAGLSPAGPRLHHADPWPQQGRYRFSFDSEAEARRAAVELQAYLDTPQRKKHSKLD